MDKSDDIYAISGRIKNLIAMEAIALSRAGIYLVNVHTLFLKELHEFASGLDKDGREQLKEILFENEKLPKNVIKLSTPKEEDMGMAFACIAPHSYCNHQRADCVLVPGGSARSEQAILIRNLLSNENVELDYRLMSDHRGWNVRLGPTEVVTGLKTYQEAQECAERLRRVTKSESDR